MKFIKLEEISDFQNGFNFASNEYVEKNKNSMEVFRMGYIERGGGFKEDKRKVYALKKSKEFLEKFELKQNDIVMAMTDMKNDVKILGCCALIRDKSRFLLNQRVGRIRLKDTNKFNPKFVYYFLNSPSQVKDLRSRANSGVQVNLSTQSIKEIMIPLYSKSEQDLIVEILNSIDQKILINYKISETLMNILNLLFKSWFINFDPVIEKRDKKKQSYSNEITDLFPNTFVKSELGKIPKNWKVSKIEDEAKIVDCLHSKKPELISEGYNFLQLNNIRDDYLLNIKDLSKISESDYKKWTSRIEVTYRDIIITNVGRVGAVATVPKNFKAAIGRNITAIRPIDKKKNSAFLATYFSSNLFKKEKLVNTDTGTILDALNVKNISKLRFINPNLDLLKFFEKFSSIIWDKRESLIKECDLLFELKKVLVPKLFSDSLNFQKSENISKEANI